jgi:hypothetical protein
LWATDACFSGCVSSYFSGGLWRSRRTRTQPAPAPALRPLPAVATNSDDSHLTVDTNGSRHPAPPLAAQESSIFNTAKNKSFCIPEIFFDSMASYPSHGTPLQGRLSTRPHCRVAICSRYSVPRLDELPSRLSIQRPRLFHCLSPEDAAGLTPRENDFRARVHILVEEGKRSRRPLPLCNHCAHGKP